MWRVQIYLAGCLLLQGCGSMPSPEQRALEGAETITWSAPSGRVVGLRAGDAQGRRVILVHGTPGSASDWSSYLTDPPAGLELVALDRPGFGASEPWGALPVLADQAAAIEPLLVERDGRWPVLVGHSLGGPIVVQAAVEYPGRVGALVVLAGNLDPELEGLRWYNTLGSLVSPLLSRPLRNSNRELGPQRAQLEALAPRLAEVSCPVIIVHGTEDDLVPFANALFLEQALSGAASVELRSLEGVDHFFIWTWPDEVRAAIERAAGWGAAGVLGGSVEGVLEVGD
jgi:pimeloyl-ACP methyl ester carboxylesterase